MLPCHGTHSMNTSNACSPPRGLAQLKPTSTCACHPWVRGTSGGLSTTSLRITGPLSMLPNADTAHTQPKHVAGASSSSSSSSPHAAALARLPAPSAYAVGLVWLCLPPQEPNTFDLDCLDLFYEWNSDKDIQFQGWVAEHASKEMVKTS